MWFTTLIERKIKIIGLSQSMQKNIWWNTIFFHDKNCQNGYRRKLYIAICDNPTANVLLNDEKLNAFPLRSGKRQSSSLSSAVFNMVLAIQARAVGQEKEIKVMQIKKEEVKLSLQILSFFYTENPKDSTKKISRTYQWIQ